MSIKQSIDHTYLKPFTTSDDIKRICQEAKENSFAAVCIPPYFVKDAVRYTEDTPVKVCTVIGYPYGYSATPAKVEEIKRALDEGVDEVDVVINICAVKAGNWSYVENDMDSMTRAVHLRGKVIKIILETALLEAEQIERLCEICNNIGCDFVKTSTGIQGGATTEDIKQLRNLLNPEIKIKASGGIKDAASALALMISGADRIGASRSMDLI